MMISNDQLRALAGHREEGPHVSLFMPTARAGAEVQQGPIRFKNLISEVESQLKGQEMRKPEIESLLSPAEERLQDGNFWQQQSDGLAFFLAREFAQSFCLAERFEELAIVEHRFHLKPLFPLISGDGAFYLLALSQNQVRLFQGSRYHISEVILAVRSPARLPMRSAMTLRKNTCSFTPAVAMSAHLSIMPKALGKTTSSRSSASFYRCSMKG